MEISGPAEWETLKWVDWYNTKRLHSAIGYVTPHEAEVMFYEALYANEKAANYLKQTLSGKLGAVQKRRISGFRCKGTASGI